MANVSRSGGSFPTVSAPIATWDPDGAGPFPENLVVAGSFNTVDHTTTVGNITYLQPAPGGHTDGTFGGGLNGPVNAIQTWDRGNGIKVVVMGGTFTGTAGGASSTGLLLWNGTSFEAFGGTLHSGVTAMTTWDPDGAGPLNTRLVVNGRHVNNDGTSMVGVASYNTTTQRFEAVGTPLGNASTDLVSNVGSLGVWDAAGNGLQPQFLFATGSFTVDDLPGNILPSPANVLLNHIGRISTGTQWLALPNIELRPPDFDGTGGVNALASISNVVNTSPRGTFIGGNFVMADNAPALNATNWNGGCF